MDDGGHVVIVRRLSRDFAVTVQLRRVEASGSPAPIVHVAREGERLTVCGRSVMFALGDHETDTVSQIECGVCKAWVERHTQ